MQAAWTEEIVLVHRTSTTSALQPTSTTLTTATLTSTSTLAPSVDTTLTSTTTLSTTNTVASTSTTTLASSTTLTATATATAYAACAPANLLGPRVADGRWIDRVRLRERAPAPIVVPAADAPACCAACAGSAECVLGQFALPDGPCWLMPPPPALARCYQPGDKVPFPGLRAGEEGSHLMLSNGPCGFFGPA